LRAATTALAASRRWRRCWRSATGSVAIVASCQDALGQLVPLLLALHLHNPLDLLRVEPVQLQEVAERVANLPLLGQRVRKLSLGPVLDVLPQQSPGPRLVRPLPVVHRKRD